MNLMPKATPLQFDQPRWYVDTSILVAILLGQSPAAATWFDSARARGDLLLASRLLDVETRRAITNRRVSGQVCPTVWEVDAHLGAIELEDIDNEVLDAATTIQVPIGGADAIHVATAARFGEVALVTHDAQQAAAAKTLGLVVVDPFTDDPRRGPVV